MKSETQDSARVCVYLEEQLCKLLCLIIRFYNTSEEGEGKEEVVLRAFGLLLGGLFLYNKRRELFVPERWKMLQLKSFFPPPKTLNSIKGSCVCGLPESFLSSSKSTDQLKDFFSGYHSQPNSTADVLCSKKSLPPPSPPAKIIILFMEAQFCFPKLHIMFLKKNQTTMHQKTLRKWGQKSIFPMLQGMRNSLVDQKSHLYMLLALSGCTVFPSRSAALTIYLKESSTNTSTDVFPLSFTLPCPKLHQLCTGDKAGSKDVSFQCLTLTNAGCVGEPHSSMNNSSIKHVSVSR